MIVAQEKLIEYIIEAKETYDKGGIYEESFHAGFAKVALKQYREISNNAREKLTELFFVINTHKELSSGDLYEKAFQVEEALILLIAEEPVIKKNVEMISNDPHYMISHQYAAELLEKAELRENKTSQKKKHPVYSRYKPDYEQDWLI